MTDMQQILAGTSELNERLQHAEAERQAQTTQHELARSQAGVKGKGKGAAVQQEQGIGALASKYRPQSFEGEDDKWREWARFFRRWSGRFLVVRWQKSSNTLRDTVTIQQPSWTWRTRH